MSDFTDTLFVFTTSPSGLGHIRVMNAIKDSKPYGIDTYDIGIVNIKANRIHDLGSRVKAFVKLTEFYQTNPVAEWIVTKFYTRFLKRHTDEVFREFKDIKTKYPNKKKWVVISTHFALAHSISSAKKRLESELGVSIYLCVIVTDDSPQRIWLVDNADLTFVASDETRSKLASYLPEKKRATLKTISFPIAERLSQNLSTTEFQFIINQVDPRANTPLQIEIPISGAAVQLTFFQKLLQSLSQSDFGFRSKAGCSFSVIGLESILTMSFFEKIRSYARVQVSIGVDTWQTVEYYESVFYQPSRPAIEITKPSEQAFKAMLNPRQRGGVILLLTTPIGRQEYDNLNFLIRNGLAPDENENEMLFNEEDLSKWIPRVKNWRALRIPEDPLKAALFIKRLKSTGIFYSMLSATIPDRPNLKSDGVRRIWDEIEKMVKLPNG